MVLAPWVVRGLRFSERLAEHFHGYDVDISSRVGAHGGTVLYCHVPCLHRRKRADDYERQEKAGLMLAPMWDATLHPPAWRDAFQL